MASQCLDAVEANSPPAVVWMLGVGVQLAISFILFLRQRNSQIEDGSDAPPFQMLEDADADGAVPIEVKANVQLKSAVETRTCCQRTKQWLLTTGKIVLAIYTVVSVVLVTTSDIIQMNKYIGSMHRRGVSFTQRFRCYSIIAIYTTNIKTLFMNYLVAQAVGIYEHMKDRGTLDQLNNNAVMYTCRAKCNETCTNRIVFIVLLLALLIYSYPMGAYGIAGCVVYVWVVIGFCCAQLVLINFGHCCLNCFYCCSCQCHKFEEASRFRELVEEGKQDPTGASQEAVEAYAYYVLKIDMLFVIPIRMICFIWLSRAFVLWAIMKDASYVEALVRAAGSWSVVTYFSKLDWKALHILHFVTALL